MDSGDTAWLLTSAAFVLLMIPGLALFYSGMTRAKSALNMLMMCFGAIATVTIVWVLYGASLSAVEGPAGLIGGLSDVGLAGTIGADALSDTIPATASIAFAGMFAIITTALIAGGIADRAKFSTWLIFTVVWASVVYVPVAYWVWGDGGWIGEMGAIDFAGGTAVHINSGAAALALALVLGRRIGWRKEQMRPHNLPMVILGAGLLWFGWFGFNAGSALAADNTAAVAFINTQAATAIAILGWLLVEKIRDGKPTTLGAASGAIAGLVAITPAASAVTPVGALVVGLLAGILCSLAVGLKSKLGYDDSLDVVGIHMVGGIVGALLIGLIASATAPEGVSGLFLGGGIGQFGIQLVAVVAVLAYSFVMTWIIGTILQKTIGFRVSADVETEGIDQHEHAETAYDFASMGGGSRATGLAAAMASGSADGASNETTKSEKEVTVQ